mgnify:CR=1 FL=1
MRLVRHRLVMIGSAYLRLYDRLFTVPDPDEEEGDFKRFLNPESLVVEQGAMIEPSVLRDVAMDRRHVAR